MFWVYWVTVCVNGWAEAYAFFALLQPGVASERIDITQRLQVTFPE